MSLNEYLTSLTSRLSAVEGKLGLESPETPIPGGGGGGGQVVEAFDEYKSAKVDPFVETSKKLGGKGAQIGEAVDNAFNSLRGYLVLASEHSKPSDPTSLMKPIVDANKAIGDLKDRDEWENHVKAVSEGMAAIGWVNPAITTPGPFCSEMADASTFWANKVRTENKDKDGGSEHVKWCTQLNDMFKGLAEFVKNEQPMGVTWNPKGKAPPSSAPASAPAAAASSSSAGGASSKPAASEGSAGGINNVFAELSQIDQSSGKTAGLKHVTKDMKAKNQADKPSTVPADAGGKKAQAKKWGGGAADAAIKNPKFEQQGNKWVIEGQTDIVTLEADKVSIKNTVYIYGCKDATIIVEGKVNSITIDSCQKTKVLFDNALALVEIVNSKSIQVQIKGNCPTATVDKTDGFTLFLSRECMYETKIVSSKSSEMNVSYPGATDDDPYEEKPVPEQFVHRVTKEGITSEVSELYSAG